MEMDDIQSALIKVISKEVGGKLWAYDNGTPAVFKAKAFRSKTPPTPRYPYASVDKANVNTPFHSPLFEGWIEDEYGVAETRVVAFTVTFYGDGSDDILSIAKSLTSRLKMQRVINDLVESGAFLYSVSQPVFSDTRIVDEYLEIAQITVSYSITDVELDPEGSGQISMIQTTGNPDR